MYEVAEHFYQELIPQAREIAHQAEEAGRTVEAEAVQKVIEDLLNRPEHTWYEEMKKTAKKDAEDRAAVVIPADAIVAPADDADAAPREAMSMILLLHPRTLRSVKQLLRNRQLRHCS